MRTVKKTCVNRFEGGSAVRYVMLEVGITISLYILGQCCAGLWPQWVTGSTRVHSLDNTCTLVLHHWPGSTHTHTRTCSFGCHLCAKFQQSSSANNCHHSCSASVQRSSGSIHISRLWRSLDQKTVGNFAYGRLPSQCISSTFFKLIDRSVLVLN